MAGVDTGGDSGGRSKHKKKHHKKRRTGVRIDMTPMVDVAFLLLTFFMLTTVMRKQQTLEINLPPNNETKVEIAESNLMTVYVDENDKIYYSEGTEKAPHGIEFNSLKDFFTNKEKSNSKIVILLKFDRKSKYHLMVDIIDQLNLAELQRFSIAPLTDNDKKFLSKAS
ncbi:MAG: biopolymer transporter ExbD [Bacteroidetes bacterium]|nr:biopolymer transporter ExbD [Bacteroidota bacterium]